MEVHKGPFQEDTSLCTGVCALPSSLVGDLADDNDHPKLLRPSPRGQFLPHNRNRRVSVCGASLAESACRAAKLSWGVWGAAAPPPP